MRLVGLSFIFFCCTIHAIEFLAEAKAGYFYPTDSKFREIYSGGGIYGVEGSIQVWRGLYPWVSGSYFNESGRSLGTRNRTEITLVPIGSGLKYFFDLYSEGNIYLGAGVLGTYLHIHDHSPYVIQSLSKWGIGGIAKIGLIINLRKHFFLDIMTDYSFLKIDFHNTHGKTLVLHEANLSGWSFGVGIGYRF